MTSSADPPLVQERARIRAIRSRGTFQLVFGAAFVVFAIVAATQAAGWWTVAIGALAGVLLVASGLVAWRVARLRLARFESAHGVGAGVLRRRTDAAEPPSAEDAPAADDA